MVSNIKDVVTCCRRDGVVLLVLVNGEGITRTVIIRVL